MISQIKGGGRVLEACLLVNSKVGVVSMCINALFGEECISWPS